MLQDCKLGWVGHKFLFVEGNAGSKVVHTVCRVKLCSKYECSVFAEELASSNSSRP